MGNRYDRNKTALSEEECALLRTKRVLVAGCGGLGGYIIETLARIGVGHITAVDGDVFDVTNLNRQLLSDETVIGRPKAEIAVERMAKVNSEVSVTAVTEFITEENAENLLSGHDLVIDALDGVPARRILAAVCEKLNITIVHGAIGGWYGQVCVVPPGSGIFDILYPAGRRDGDNSAGNPPFTPAVTASLEATEAVKLLCGKPSSLEKKLLLVNLKSMEVETIELG